MFHADATLTHKTWQDEHATNLRFPNLPMSGRDRFAAWVIMMMTKFLNFRAKMSCCLQTGFAKRLDYTKTCLRPMIVRDLAALPVREAIPGFPVLAEWPVATGGLRMVEKARSLP